MERSNFPGRKQVKQNKAKVRHKVPYEVKLKAVGPKKRKKLLAKGG